jgi:transposase InsO family protein
MRERGINAKQKRRRIKTTDSQHSNPVAPNLLKRDFTADAPNTTWVADITGIETLEGWHNQGSHRCYLLAAGCWLGHGKGACLEQLITLAAVMAVEDPGPRYAENRT